MTKPYILYGTQASLYTGKARAYLRKQHIPFEERAVGVPSFRERIVPQLGRWIMPVLEAPDGSLIQDGSVIIDHFEAEGGRRLPAIPPTPLHKVISYLFELFGGEGLLRPAMHYRWNFDPDNYAFLSYDFPSALAPGTTGDEAKAVFDFASGRMNQAMKSFGVNAESIPLVEAGYAEFLRLFSAHLELTPYLLGGRPTLGDYGLVAPLYAHLGRDPHPAHLMKTTAPRVWRWVERMNAPQQDAVEYLDCPEDLFPADGVPDTLKALMRFIAEEYLPELTAHVAFANDWLAARPDLETGTNGLEKPGARGIGMARFAWRGMEIETAVLPYRFYLLQRVQDAVDRAQGPGRAAVEALLAETGLAALLDLRTHRRVERKGHLEVWGPDRSRSS